MATTPGALVLADPSKGDVLSAELNGGTYVTTVCRCQKSTKDVETLWSYPREKTAAIVRVEPDAAIIRWVRIEGFRYRLERLSASDSETTCAAG